LNSLIISLTGLDDNSILANKSSELVR